LEDPAFAVSCDDRIITSSQDDGMASDSTLVSSSLEKGMSTTRTPRLAGGCTTFDLAMVPLDPSNSDQVGKPCALPPSKAGSLVFLISSSATIGGGTMRVISDLTSTITMGIATIAVAVLATGWEDTTPSREGHAAANLLPSPLIVTRCRLGLYSSRTGGGDIPSPASP